MPVRFRPPRRRPTYSPVWRAAGVMPGTLFRRCEHPSPVPAGRRELWFAMIDYEHIPAHLRCSDRHLIVPNYPGGCKWWALEERKRNPGQYVGVFEPHEFTEQQQLVMDTLISEGPLTTFELGKKTGLTKNQIKFATTGLTYKVPLWQQAGRGCTGATKYGILRAQEG